MKKTLAMICGAAIMICAAGCSKKSSDVNTKADGTQFTPAEINMGDSLAISLGKIAGADQLMAIKTNQIRLSDDELARFSKKEFLKGLEYALSIDTANVAFREGLRFGMQLYMPVLEMKRQTYLPIDQEKVVGSFKEVFMLDSVPDYSAYEADFRKRSMEARDRSLEIAAQRLRESEAYKHNTAAGEEYAKKMEAEGYEKSESGLLYKIDNPGTGDKVINTDRVNVKYEGRHIDGTVFDSNEGFTGVPTQFVRGFGEGLRLLGKGGKATIVIPAELGYGEYGAGGQIGPNETLVFDIEVLDITPRK